MRYVRDEKKRRVVKNVWHTRYIGICICIYPDEIKK